MSRERLLELGVTGRCCALPASRGTSARSTPILAYDDFDFKIPVGTVGDGWDRFRVRVQEMRESVRIVEQALDGLPEGPWIADDRKVVLPPRHELSTSMEALIHHFKLVTEGFRVPPGEAYYAVESPRGELGCFILADGSAKPARVHFRDPSFVNLQALRDMCVGGYLADLIQNLAMLDPILGGIDQVSTTSRFPSIRRHHRRRMSGRLERQRADRLDAARGRRAGARAPRGRRPG